MARKRPFFRPQIDDGIAEKLKQMMLEQRYHGSMAAFIEGILDRYTDGLLVESGETKKVHGIRVRRVVAGEERKTA